MFAQSRRFLCSAAGSSTKRAFRVSDYLRPDANGNMVTTVTKLEHPHRVQRVMIVPVPLVGTDQYFDDWVYQPYIKDHILVWVSGVYHPYTTWVPQLLMSQNMFGSKGYTFFRFFNMPDPVDTDLKRTEFYNKQSMIWLNPLKFWWYPNRVRDRNHPWVYSGIQKLVGVRYLTHPQETHRNYVVMCPATQIHTAINGLNDLGFNVAESLDVEIGKKDVIEKIEAYGAHGETVCLTYVWALVLLFINGVFWLVYDEYYKWVQEEFAKVGEDPNDYGYNFAPKEKQEV